MILWVVTCAASLMRFSVSGLRAYFLPRDAVTKLISSGNVGRRLGAFRDQARNAPRIRSILELLAQNSDLRDS